MGKLRMHLSGLIPHFVEKDEEKAGEKITGSNNTVFHLICLLGGFGNLKRPIGRLGY